MAKQSAGLLPYRMYQDELQVFLVHPGGPFWAKKDAGVWSIAKGEFLVDEEALTAAVREFREETGFLATPPFHPLGSIRQSSSKTVYAWAFAGDYDPTQLVSNTCPIEWPPRSGSRIEIPEVDRAAWFPVAEARNRVLATQQPFLDRLLEFLK